MEKIKTFLKNFREIFFSKGTVSKFVHFRHDVFDFLLVYTGVHDFHRLF